MRRSPKSGALAGNVYKRLLLATGYPRLVAFPAFFIEVLLGACFGGMVSRSFNTTNSISRTLCWLQGVIRHSTRVAARVGLILYPCAGTQPGLSPHRLEA